MKLENNSPIIAPPVLKGWSQTVSQKIQTWPNIISATHLRFGDPT